VNYYYLYKMSNKNARNIFDLLCVSVQAALSLPDPYIFFYMEHPHVHVIKDVNDQYYRIILF
jgi:hypothetical protein